MLPILMFNNMEGGSNSMNNGYVNFYDENVVLNSVRNRKKVTELPNCPVCSCTIRQGELESHLASEVERLQKLSCSSSKRKLHSGASVSSHNLAVPGSSTSTEFMDTQELDFTGCPGADDYQRVHSNRLKRLRARRRSTPPSMESQCPVCDAKIPTWKIQRHTLRCLKKTGANVDEDIPDSSSEEGSIDVENDVEDSNRHSGFGSEYEWCGEVRIRASALQDSEMRAGIPVRRASRDHNLIVDGDEDAELYGPPQYSPSRIAPDAVITPSEDLETEETMNDDSETMNGVCGTESLVEDERIKEDDAKHEGKIQASAETRIQALKARIRELEKKQHSATEAKCLICLSGYISPAVSIQCWHVYCEVCWLQSLKAKKICPQCNAITTTEHLRRVYM